MYFFLSLLLIILFLNPPLLLHILCFSPCHKSQFAFRSHFLLIKALPFLPGSWTCFRLFILFLYLCPCTSLSFIINYHLFLSVFLHICIRPATKKLWITLFPSHLSIGPDNLSITLPSCHVSAFTLFCFSILFSSFHLYRQCSLFYVSFSHPNLQTTSS